MTILPEIVGVIDKQTSLSRNARIASMNWKSNLQFMHDCPTTPHLVRAASQLPVVTVTGPRQSGKTTLCRSVFPEKRYVNLEPIDTRELALSDPRGFLAELPDGAILDEIQNAPDLLSYIQADVDENSEPGRFILTGSQQLALTASISQTLAGSLPSWSRRDSTPLSLQS